MFLLNNTIPMKNTNKKKKNVKKTFNITNIIVIE